MAADTLKAQAQSRDLKVGHFIVEFATPGIGHMLKNAGCDFVLFDTEHSGFHNETIKSVMRYFEAARLPAIVRVPSKEYHHIARAADMGAEGIMLPMVNDAQEARQILDCMKYVPQGQRGVALGVAHDLYKGGAVLDKLAAANARTTFFAQIETRAGVENADAIAALDGVDCLWVGHFDLSASLGIPGQFEHKDFLDAIDTVVRACRKHGKATGRLVPDVATGADYNAKGFDYICYSGDVWAYQAAVKAGVDGIREACGAGKMTRFKVALSGDFRKADGSPTYPSFDLSPLTGNSDVEVVFVDAVDGVMPAAGLAGCDALILLVPKFTAASVPADGKLAVVARFGVGYDSVDVPACTEHGIALVITPDGVRRPVAVSILTYILALTQKLLIKDRLCRQGPDGWAKRSDHMGVGLVGKTLGQLGMGNIGAEVFRLAAPFGMRFLAHDPYQDPKIAAELGVELVGLEELFQRTDFLSVSVPLSEATHHIVGERLLGLMKPTAYVINTSRGPVVDQRALHRALTDGTIAGAGLDVFEVEPCPADEPILQLDNVVVAPHALCWTDECFAGNGAADVRAVLEVMQGRVPNGIVNRDVVNQAAWRGKLAALEGRTNG